MRKDGQKGDSMLLDLGCGDRPFEDGRGWTHMDERPLPDVEIVGNVRWLQQYVGINSCDEILARHILEHFPHVDTINVLREWRACLNPGGKITIEVPNLLWQAQALAMNVPDPSGKTYTDAEVVELIFGSQDYSGNYHKTGFTVDTLFDSMDAAGFDCSVHDIGQVLVAQGVKR